MASKWQGVEAALGGAALLGFVDVALRAPLQGEGFLVESARIVLAGDFLVAAGLALLLLAVARGRTQGAGFLLGLGVAAAPLSSAWLPAEFLGLVVAAAGVGLALTIGGRFELPRFLARGAALAGGLSLLLAWLLPSSTEPRLPPAPPQAAQGPDVVLVSCDTLRADAVSEHFDALPHLAGLRDRGVWAPYALAPSSTTRPSHVAMLTGLGALEHTVTRNANRLDPDLPLLSVRFREAGWRTVAVVSNPILRGGAGFARGFERYDELAIVRQGPLRALRRFARKHTWLGWLGLAEASLPAEPLERGNGRLTTARARGWLEQLQEGAAPFFLFVHYMDPHSPYRPPGVETGGAGDTPRIRDLAERLASGEEDLARPIARLAELYHAEVAAVDAALGDLLEAIEAGGRPTIVLFTADHGEQFGEHGLLEHSNSLYEPLVRVPFLLTGPGVEPRRLAAPPRLRDVAPTLLTLAGLATPSERARSLVARGDAGSAGFAEPAIHVERLKELVSLRRGPHKLLAELRLEDGVLRAAPVALFDVEADPHESGDLRSAEPALAQSLHRELEALLDAHDVVLDGAPDEAASHRAALVELGYADGEEEEPE